MNESVCDLSRRSRGAKVKEDGMRPFVTKGRVYLCVSDSAKELDRRGEEWR